eukprot:1189197-Prorocentrum_minimum.AAC.6
MTTASRRAASRVSVRAWSGEARVGAPEGVKLRRRPRGGGQKGSPAPNRSSGRGLTCVTPRVNIAAGLAGAYLKLNNGIAFGAVLSQYICYRLFQGA